jgi:flagellar basal body-associated protein FliL
MEQTLSLILMIIKSPVTHLLIGAFLGFLASNNIENRNQKNLNTSLYQEADRISKQFKDYLPILVNQLNKPKQDVSLFI